MVQYERVFSDTDDDSPMPSSQAVSVLRCTKTHVVIVILAAIAAVLGMLSLSLYSKLEIAQLELANVKAHVTSFQVGYITDWGKFSQVSSPRKTKT